MFIIQKQGAIAGASILGTTLMSLFSYTLSLLFRKNFKEPVLLGAMMQGPVGAKTKKAILSGWLTHYLVGLLFAEVYALFWQDGPTRVQVKQGLVLGGISGFAAILIWKFFFVVHPFPPSVDFVAFATQLFFAHVVFAVFATLGFAKFKSL